MSQSSSHLVTSTSASSCALSLIRLTYLTSRPLIRYPISHMYSTQFTIIRRVPASICIRVCCTRERHVMWNSLRAAAQPNGIIDCTSRRAASGEPPEQSIEHQPDVHAFARRAYSRDSQRRADSYTQPRASFANRSASVRSRRLISFAVKCQYVLALAIHVPLRGARSPLRGHLY